MSGRPSAEGPPDPTDAARVLRRMADAQSLHEALVLVRALEHTTATRAGASLLDVGLATGHSPVCVARQLLHLVFPATHPNGSAALEEAVQRRWRWPLHQLRRPDHAPCSRVWDRAVAPGAVVPSPHPQLN